MHNDWIRKLSTVCVALAVLLVAAPALAADEAPAEPRPLVVTLEHLGELIARLEAQLGALDRPGADRLEERVAEAGDLIEDLLASLESTPPSPREQAAKLHMALHRLVTMLGEIVGGPDRRPERDRARETLDELRAWVDGYVAAMTTGMNARDAERYSRAAHDLARALMARLSEAAKKAAPAPQPAAPRLSVVIERLDTLAARLDALLQRIAEAQSAKP
jgi:hypothetical protein